VPYGGSVVQFANVPQSFVKEFYSILRRPWDLPCLLFLDSVVEARNKWVPVLAALKMSVSWPTPLWPPCVLCLLVCAASFRVRANLWALLLAILSAKVKATPPVTHLPAWMDWSSPLLLRRSLVLSPGVLPSPYPTRVLPHHPTFLVPHVHSIWLCI